jgi:hypothetical protein
MTARPGPASGAGGPGKSNNNGGWGAKSCCRPIATIAQDALEHALALASDALRCFPCAANKRPTTPHGLLDASADPQALRLLWADYPGPLVGVRTGATSGIDALDIDRKHDEAVRWFASRRDRLPATRVHRTRSGGLHLLFQHTSGMRCSAGLIIRGVDVRADGGYVIWWPAAGLPVLRDAPPAPWPAWLRAQLMPLAQPVRPRITIPDRRTLAGLVRLVAGAREGDRNNVVFWAACRVGEMVASGLLDSETAVAMMAEAASRAGLPRAEAARTARSGVRTGGGAHA